MANEESLKPQPNPQPTPAPRMTEAAFVEELRALFKRGDEAGLSATNIAIRVCFRRGVSRLDEFLDTVANQIGPTDRKK